MITERRDETEKETDWMIKEGRDETGKETARIEKPETGYMKPE